MANSSPIPVGVITVVEFAAAIAIALWPAGGWAQGGIDQGSIAAHFEPATPFNLEARPVPAKVTAEQDSALTSKGYVQIGTITAKYPGKNGDAEITRQIESKALRRAAEAGGDVVHLSSHVETESLEEAQYKNTCTQRRSMSAGDGRGGVTWTDVGCAHWEQVPTGKTTTELVDFLVSEGTVWRYDPKLAASLAAAEAERLARPENRIFTAVLNDDIATVTMLLRDHPDLVNAKAGEYHDPLLQQAVLSEDKAMVELLLEKGADVDATDDGHHSACYWAEYFEKNHEKDGKELSQRYKEIADLLRQHGAGAAAAAAAAAEKQKREDNEKICGPLHDALLKGDYAKAEFLLAHGTDVNVRDANYGNGTQLLQAATHGEKEIAEFLLAHGADINAADSDGSTPLIAAASAGNKEMVELLLLHGADVNAKDHHFETALSYAKILGHKGVAKLLRQHGGLGGPD